MWLKWILPLLISLPAWSYKLTPDFSNGFYWNTLPVGIVVVESNPERKSMLEDLAQAAIQEWEQRTGFALWDYGATGTKNIIRWSTKFAAETQMDPSSVLAVAIRYTNGPYFAKTEIIINGNHELNKYENYLRTTLTHELGHTMGLDHSDVNAAVMAPTLQAVYYGLDDDDVEGMTDTYNQTQYRQLTGYISPLSYSSSEEKQAMSCGTVGVTSAQGSGFQGTIALAGGILISFIRKLASWFKSLF